MSSMLEFHCNLTVDFFFSAKASCELAEKDGAYKTYEGSPISKGVSFHNE